MQESPIPLYMFLGDRFSSQYYSSVGLVIDFHHNIMSFQTTPEELVSQRQRVKNIFLDSKSEDG